MSSPKTCYEYDLLRTLLQGQCITLACRKVQDEDTKQYTYLYDLTGPSSYVFPTFHSLKELSAFWHGYQFHKFLIPPTSA